MVIYLDIKLNCFRNGKDEAIGVSDIIENELKKKYSCFCQQKGKHIL